MDQDTMKLSVEQDISSATPGDTVNGEHTIELQAGEDEWGNAKDPNIGLNEEMRVNTLVTTALAGAGASVVATLETSDNSDMSSPSDVLSFAIPALSALKSRFSVPIPPTATVKVYNRMKYVIASGQTLTAGGVTTKISMVTETRLWD